MLYYLGELYKEKGGTTKGRIIAVPPFFITYRYTLKTLTQLTIKLEG